MTFQVLTALQLLTTLQVLKIRLQVLTFNLLSSDFLGLKKDFLKSSEFRILQKFQCLELRTNFTNFEIKMNLKKLYDFLKNI